MLHVPRTPGQKQSPAERLQASAARLFRERGLRVTLREIAADAETREETAIKRFTDIDGLLAPHVQGLINKSRALWREAGSDKIDKSLPFEELVAQCDAVLRQWVKLIERQSKDVDSPHRQLARIWVQLQLPERRHCPITRFVEEYRSNERDMIFDLCNSGRYRDYESVAHYIVLLVTGALHEEQRYYGSNRQLSALVTWMLDAHAVEEESEPAPNEVR